VLYGGIEAGGTKWVCAIGDGNGKLLESGTVPTTTPVETISRTALFFLNNGPLEAIGVGAFGPVDLDSSSATFGYITTTPKPGWSHTDVASRLRVALGLPVVVDTDVNAAALGEWRWGAGRGLGIVSYVTVGTGIGGGSVIDGRPLHGLSHPEFGHIRVPHDRTRDPFDGSCPYHGVCLEGLASGQALRMRYGRGGEDITDPAAWELEAEYVALGLLDLVLTLSPHRIIVGGGVAKQQCLIPLVRSRVRELAAGYMVSAAFAKPSGLDDYIVRPQLGDHSGVHGAIELARRASERMSDTSDRFHAPGDWISTVLGEGDTSVCARFQPRQSRPHQENR